MMIRKLTLTIAAAALAAAPVAAQAAPTRTASPVGAEEELKGALLPVVIAILLALGIVLLLDGDDEPTSP